MVITPNNHPATPDKNVFSFLHFAKTGAYFPMSYYRQMADIKECFYNKFFSEPELFEETELMFSIEDL